MKRVVVGTTIVCGFLVTADVVGRGAGEEEIAGGATTTDEEDNADEEIGIGWTVSAGSLPAPITGTDGTTTLDAVAAGMDGVDEPQA